MAICTFKRKELKYFVTPLQYELIKNELLKHMEYDQYCQNGASYMIYNLYFDTQDDAVIRRSIQKPYYKEKLRLRAYQPLSSGFEPIFLELKKKIGGTVSKRRLILPYNSAMEFVTHGKIPETTNVRDGQVLTEIRWFLQRNDVYPKVYISYERVAFFGRSDSGLRVSFDQNILTRRSCVDLIKGDYGAPLLEDKMLMEIKCQGSIPLWLTHILSEQKIYRTSFSKYGTEFKTYMRNLGHIAA